MSNSYTDEEFVKFYDLITSCLRRGQIDIWKFFAKEYAKNEPILEMGCGTGNNVLPLAEDGYSVMGIDNSPLMLEVCRQKLAKADLVISSKVKVILGALVNPPIHLSEFGLIFFEDSVFLHISNDEQRMACLKNSSKWLSKNGLLVISNRKLKEEKATEWRKYLINLADGRQLYTKVEFKNGVYADGFKVVSLETQKKVRPFWWTFYPVDELQMKELIHKSGLACQAHPQKKTI